MIRVKSTAGNFYAEGMENIGHSKIRFKKVSQFGPQKTNHNQLILSSSIIILLEMIDDEQ